MNDFEVTAALVKALATAAEMIGDVKLWKERASEVLKAAEKAAADLFEAHQLHDFAADHRKAAEQHLEDARYERGQAEFSKRELQGAVHSLEQRQADITKREQELAAATAQHENNKRDHEASLSQRKAAIDAHHADAEEKLRLATELKTHYEAKLEALKALAK